MNNIVLVGEVIRSEVRYTPNGTASLEATVKGSFLGGNGNQMWWYQRVNYMGKQAEKIAGQITAGTQESAGTRVCVFGALDFQTWTNPDGAKRSKLETKALRVHITTNTTDVNQVTLFGGLTKETELRYTPQGDVVCSGSLAVTDSWTDKDGNWQEKTHYVDLTAWRDQGEWLGEQIKGTKALITGMLLSGSYTDKDGVQKYTNKLTVSQGVATVRMAAKEEELPI